MAEKTDISWCDATFNPWWGCTKVSPACDNCYAERDSKRFAGGRVLWGVGAERRTFGDAHWQAPLAWAKRAFEQCNTCGWRGRHIHLKHVDGRHYCPSCGGPDWQPARQRVFCASMGDWLDLDPPIDEFVRLMETVRVTPELDWLLLSKRIGNLRKRLEEALARVVETEGSDSQLAQWLESWMLCTPPTNVWLGATVIDQEEFDRDVPKLILAPARVRFVSIEPMLGRIDLGLMRYTTTRERFGNGLMLQTRRRAIDWVIAGGESGPHARPLHPEWPRDLRDQCAEAGVPFHFKQWGEWAATSSRAASLSALPGNLCRVQSPGSPDHYVAISSDGLDATTILRIGRDIAGRTIGGYVHAAFPVPKTVDDEEPAAAPA